MAKPVENDDVPDPDRDNSPSASAPMIIGGQVVDGPSDSEILPADQISTANEDVDAAPMVRPRNAMANTGLLLGIASLLVNPLAVTSILALAASFLGLRKALALFRSEGVSVGRYPATLGLALGAGLTVFTLWMRFNPPVAG